MPKGPQGQKRYFHVELWHVCAIAAIFLIGLGLTARNLFVLHVSLLGDLIGIASTGFLLALYVWRYRTQRS